MRLLHIQAKARQDIKNIWRYSYKEWGEKQADKYYDELISGINLIKENPNIGISCDNIRSGYRQYQINEHIAFYRLSEKKIHIVRILYKKMEFQKYLQFHHSIG